MGKEKGKADLVERGNGKGWPENYRPRCQRPTTEFEHFDRDESVLDAMMRHESDKEAENAATQNEATENAVTEMEIDNEVEESDSIYICGSEADTDDVSVSDGGSDFDEEYVMAREKKKNLISAVVDSINGLGLDAMLDAPGAVSCVNGKYWEGGARPATSDGNRYVTGAVSTAVAARKSNKAPMSSQQGSTTTKGGRAAQLSQEGSTANPGSCVDTSVMFKSTASQAATPRVHKLPVRKGKQ